jgi:secreted transglycosylase
MMMGGDQERNDPAVSASAGSVTGVPAEYQAAVLRAGSMCPEVPAPIIAAQIEAESAWDPTAASEAGAQGLTQFMPGTWAQYGIDGDGDGVADVWSPQDAIASQGAYMCALVGIVKGYLDQGIVSGDATDLALAAYNAGPGAVLDQGGIPSFEQTQAYVPKIMAMAAVMAQDTVGGGGGGDRGATILATARSKIGLPYVWGAEGPDGYDCSGLVKEAYQSAGIELVHSSGQQCSAGTVVTKENAQPGDLVCWDGHVALWVGGDQIIEAPTEGVPVRETTIYEMAGGPYFVHIDQ